ncbi:TonB-dependent receptor [Nitrospirillum viridazoti]|uniref:TonB-dependent receptor n=1 Tax=Nitrospirillum viridazoti TaxID=3144925 RepID=UPI000B0DF67D|nr:TonB-dependent receptor [Nitrospirillum amazonense]TWB36999.1 outer membrane receptor protein involved in Fe transport [Nitrospirillum amazonense]
MAFKVGRAGVMGAILLGSVSTVALAADNPAGDAAAEPAGASGQLGNSSASGPVPEIVITAKRLLDARNSIQPDLGASTYKLDESALEAQPGGVNNGLNQVMLQAPGVAQDSFGQLHIRGEHANVQYRINGVILPEGISGFGQTLSPRFAHSVSLVTGALPAQYGLRTAGIIDIQTKSGAFDNGGDISVYGGSYNTLQTSFDISGSSGNLNYFASGDFKTSGVGIESPDGSGKPNHDRTENGRGFVFLQDILDPDTQVSLMAGTERGQFQIPTRSGQSPSLGYNFNGQTDYPSDKIDENQREITHYAAATYLKALDAVTIQSSVYGRYSSLWFKPDPVPDLLYNGISQEAYRRSIAGGWQTDGSWVVNDHHTLRAGLLLQVERSSGITNSQVFPVDDDGNQIGSTPTSVHDTFGKTGYSESVYIQDEWKFAPDWTLNVGGRFDSFQQFDSESQFSPRVNLVWQATPGTTVHAGYSRYFTPPPFELVSNTAVTKYAGTSAAAASSINDAPKAERANYFDVGIEQKLTDALTVGLDGYYKKSKNMLDEGQFGAPIILTPFNYDEGTQKGVELSLTYAVDNFQSYANFAVSKAEGKKIVSSQFSFSQDDLDYISNHFIPVDHDQRFTASAGASYRIDRTLLTTDLIYGSGLRADGATPNGAALPGYVQVNFGAVQTLDLPTVGLMDVRFDVINVFDEKYEIRDGTGVGVGAPQYGPRRGFYFGVTKTF